MSISGLGKSGEDAIKLQTAAGKGKTPQTPPKPPQDVAPGGFGQKLQGQGQVDQFQSLGGQ